MSDFSLYDRFTKQGTLSEPGGVPDPRYALPSTVHWMRSYRMLIDDVGLNYGTAEKFFASEPRKQMSETTENSIFEHLLLALHQVSALKALASCTPQSDVTRVASVAWYYGIYAAATAMVAAQDGSLQDNHTQTARSWDNQLVLRGRTMPPFDLRVSTLVKKEAIVEIDAYRRGPKTNLVNPPATIDDAHNYICAYLSGSRGWWAWRAEEGLRKSREFRELGVENFRTKEARRLRDQRLAGQAISFMHQAIRFRGKANYREALYLAHGTSVENQVTGFAHDMADVLEAFLAMAGAFAFKRLGSDLRDAFIDDVRRHSSFSLHPADVWS